MRWLPDQVVARLQGGLAAPIEGDPETEVDLHLKGQILGDRFVLQGYLGSGGMGTAYKAEDLRTNGPAVVKIIHPSLVGNEGSGASLAVLKEAAALGALERLPSPTRHVVRLLATGIMEAHGAEGERIDLPWLGLEFVDGGDEGTTLEERVGHAVRATGFGFGAERAAVALDGIAEGLEAIRAAGVVHRDIKPANILCAASGGIEVWKLADFGLSRPGGAVATFGGLVVGTVGYAPPELMSVVPGQTGPTVDVFGFGALLYFLLAGEHLFPSGSPRDVMRVIKNPERKKLLASSRLSAELRKREPVCEKLDEAILGATAADPAKRTPSARQFAEQALTALRGTPRAAVTRREPRLRLTKRPGPTIEGRIVSAAWDGFGRCLAATTAGLFLDEGQGFGRAPQSFADLPPIRFVARIGPGRFLLGGERATFATATAQGPIELVRGQDPAVQFHHFSGDVDDLGVLSGTRPGTPPALYAFVGRYWLKPLPLGDLAELRALARVDRTRWLLTGKGRDGRPFVATYAPLEWEVVRLPADGFREVIACAGDASQGVGLAVGATGEALVVTNGTCKTHGVRTNTVLSSAHVDHTGRAWVGGLGTVFLLDRGERSFVCVFEDTTLPSPFVALATEGDKLLALTEDGATFESKFS